MLLLNIICSFFFLKSNPSQTYNRGGYISSILSFSSQMLNKALVKHAQIVPQLRGRAFHTAYTTPLIHGNPSFVGTCSLASSQSPISLSTATSASLSFYSVVVLWGGELGNAAPTPSSSVTLGDLQTNRLTPSSPYFPVPVTQVLFPFKIYIYIYIYIKNHLDLMVVYPLYVPPIISNKTRKVSLDSSHYTPPEVIYTPSKPTPTYTPSSTTRPEPVDTFIYSYPPSSSASTKIQNFSQCITEASRIFQNLKIRKNEVAGVLLEWESAQRCCVIFWLL
jgi:hypothetical protein